MSHMVRSPGPLTYLRCPSLVRYLPSEWVDNRTPWGNTNGNFKLRRVITPKSSVVRVSVVSYITCQPAVCGDWTMWWGFASLRLSQACQWFLLGPSHCPTVQPFTEIQNIYCCHKKIVCLFQTSRSDKVCIYTYPWNVRVLRRGRAPSRSPSYLISPMIDHRSSVT